MLYEYFHPGQYADPGLKSRDQWTIPNKELGSYGIGELAAIEKFDEKYADFYEFSKNNLKNFK